MKRYSGTLSMFMHDRTAGFNMEGSSSLGKALRRAIRAHDHEPVTADIRIERIAAPV